MMNYDELQKAAGESRLLKITDPEELMPFVRAAVVACPKAVADYGRGKTAALKQVLGQVMRVAEGRADPVMAEKMIRELADEMNKM